MRVSRGYRRNERSPTKGIDTPDTVCLHIFEQVEMREARLRALTHEVVCHTFICLVVEMREARLRALTRTKDGVYQVKCHFCRNERSPTKGIDTSFFYLFFFPHFSVEMREARLRALTHHLDLLLFYFFSNCRNERSPFDHIHTPQIQSILQE